MKRKIVYALAGVCLLAVVALLMPTLAYNMPMDSTKINHFTWGVEEQPTQQPTQEPTTPVEPEANQYIMAVRKQFSTVEPTTAAQFSFNLTSQDKNAPMPAGQVGGTYSFAINGASKVSLPPISYNKAGKYTYTVAEQNTAQAGYTYDTSVYTVVVNVQKKGDKIELAGVDISMKSSGKEYKNLTEIVFTNAYTPSGGSGELPKMSDSAPIEMYWTLLAISALGFVGCCVFLIYKRNKTRYGKK